jgi:hypothetical protein
MKTDLFFQLTIYALSQKVGAISWKNVICLRGTNAIFPFNRNTHSFKAITKLTSSGLKEPLLYSTVGGGGLVHIFVKKLIENDVFMESL